MAFPNENNPNRPDAVSNLTMRSVHPRVQRAVDRQRIASAGARLHDSRHSEMTRQIVGHLATMHNIADGFGQIRAWRKGSPDQQQMAARAIQAHIDQVRNAHQQASELYPQLRQAVLRDTAPARPAGASEAAALDRKSDLVAALENAGPYGAQQLAERIVQAAVEGNTPDDALTLHALLGDPMRLQASRLGIDQARLQGTYAAAQSAAEGPHPLMGSAVPNLQMIEVLSDIETAIEDAFEGAMQELENVAAGIDE